VKERVFFVLPSVDRSCGPAHRLPPHTLQLLFPLIKTIGNNGWVTATILYTCRLLFLLAPNSGGRVRCDADAKPEPWGSSARISSRVSELRAAVVQLPVNNRLETGSPRHASFSTATGWFSPSHRRSSWPADARFVRRTRTALSCPCAETPRSAHKLRTRANSAALCGVSKHDGTPPRPHPSRRAHARSTWLHDLARALLRMRTSVKLPNI
jgi:hypothetical protein